MRELVTGRARTLIEGSAAASPEAARKRVYDAQHQHRLPGKLARSEHKSRSENVEVNEAYAGSGGRHGRQRWLPKAPPRFRRNARFLRLHIRRMSIQATLMPKAWPTNAAGRAGQFSTALGYSGQTGALNEHLSDAFGIMVKQYKLDQAASESDWLGAELFGPGVAGRAVRSMAAPGTAYDDPVLGRDPQPSHMRDYVDTVEDNGGVHINSGILNHAFYRAAMAIGGRTWQVLGKIWYVAMTERLKPEADFHDFARATVDIAGELYGNGGAVQRIIAEAWSAVGLTVPLFGCAEQHLPIRRRRPRAAAIGGVSKWRQRPSR